MKKIAEDHIIAMFHTLQDIHSLSIPTIAQNADRPIGFNSIRKRHGLASTYVYTMQVLTNMKLVQPVNNGYLWNQCKSAPTMQMAKLVCEMAKSMLNEKRLERGVKETVVKTQKTTTQSVSVATLRDEELVAELRKRGYTVQCYKDMRIEL